MSNLTLVSKLTIKTLKAQPASGSITEPKMIATLYGRCNDKKVGTSDYGEFVRFKGEFEGVNADTGETYRAGAMIVPGILESLLDSAIAVNENNAVDFAVEVWVEPSERSMTGYTYSIKPLIQPEESDALAELRNLAKGKLPAPEEAEETADE